MINPERYHLQVAMLGPGKYPEIYVARKGTN